MPEPQQCHLEDFDQGESDLCYHLELFNGAISSNTLAQSVRPVCVLRNNWALRQLIRVYEDAVPNHWARRINLELSVRFISV